MDVVFSDSTGLETYAYYLILSAIDHLQKKITLNVIVISSMSLRNGLLKEKKGKKKERETGPKMKILKFESLSSNSHLL